MTPYSTPTVRLELESRYLTDVPSMEGYFEANVISSIQFPSADVTISCQIVPTSSVGTFTYNPFTGAITLSNATATYAVPKLLTGEAPPALSKIYAIAAKGVSADGTVTDLGTITFTKATGNAEVALISPPDGSWLLTVPLGQAVVSTTRVAASVNVAASYIELAIVGQKA